MDWQIDLYNGHETIACLTICTSNGNGIWRMCFVLLQMVCGTRFTSSASLTFWRGMASRSVRLRPPRQWNTAQRPRFPLYVQTRTLADSSSLLRKSQNRQMNCSVLVLWTVGVVCQQLLMLGSWEMHHYCIIPLLVCRSYCKPLLFY